MASSSLVGSLKATELEKAMGSTILGRCGKSIEEFIVSNLKIKEGTNFFLPEMGYLRSSLKGLEGKLLTLYDGEMGMFDTVADIPDKLKVLQASLMDGLVFAYDLQTGKVTLHTLNFKVLSALDIEDTFQSKKCMEKNRRGVIYSYRVDISYYDETGFSFKGVSLNKNTELIAENTAFVPYVAVSKSFALISSLLDRGSVLKVLQTLGSVDKERYITKSENVLAKYCDDASAVAGLEPAYFPLNSFFYAPVLGAPSTTSMVTRVDVFKLDRIDMVNSSSEIKVKKPEDPVLDMIGSSVVSSKVQKMLVNDAWDFVEIMKKAPKSNMFTDWGTISVPDVSHYLNSLSTKEKEKVYKLLDVEGDISKKIKTMGSFSLVKPEDGKNWTNDEVKSLLKSNICSILIRKSDCTLSKVLGTNNTEILKEIYGNDYFGKYESLNSRCYELCDELRLGRPVKEALTECGFSTEDRVVNWFNEKLAQPTTENGSFSDDVKWFLAEGEGIKATKSSSTTNILVRRCFAVESEEGIADYYRYIDVKKIQSIAIVG